MKRRFEGFYFKHQSGERTLALIPGVSSGEAFIQIITDTKSYNVSYPRDWYRRSGEQIRIGGSVFSPDGVKLDIESCNIRLSGELEYSGLTPLNSDIMGPFQFLPMQCRHGVVSMRHTVNGGVTLNGEPMDFYGGIGYIESDSGRSFPKGYAWIQCGDFERDCSIMASVAHIPFAGAYFWGCICAVWLDGREYRIATYNGAKILRRERGVIELSQGKYLFEARADAGTGHALSAPLAGAMTRTIHESASCPAYFRFCENESVLFEGKSVRASYEFAFE